MKKTLILGFLILLISCNKAIVFEESFPENAKCLDYKSYCEQFFEVKGDFQNRKVLEQEIDNFLEVNTLKSTKYEEFRMYFFENSLSRPLKTVYLENLLYEVRFNKYGEEINKYHYIDGYAQGKGNATFSIK